MGAYMKKHIANIITACRILGSVIMLLCSVKSVGFCALYLLCGFTDMIDGFAARRLNTASELGARLDTAADIAFAAAYMIKLLPIMNIPRWLWACVAVIAAVKMGNIILGFIKNKKLTAQHTVMNKITGLLLFFLPLTMPFIELKYSAAVACVMAAVSAIQEMYCTVSGCERV